MQKTFSCDCYYIIHYIIDWIGSYFFRTAFILMIIFIMDLSGDRSFGLTDRLFGLFNL